VRTRPANERVRPSLSAGSSLGPPFSREARVRNPILDTTVTRFAAISREANEGEVL